MKKRMENEWLTWSPERGDFPAGLPRRALVEYCCNTDRAYVHIAMPAECLRWRAVEFNGRRVKTSGDIIAYRRVG